MFSTKVVSALIFSLATLQAVSAAPAVQDRADYPDVIPGEGLPSLESLGLTVAELYETPLPQVFGGGDGAANFDARCGPSDGAYTQVNGIIACYNYLRNLGTTRCGIGPGNPTQFCRSGDAQATGQSYRSQSESSYCSDVAIGLLWVVDHCTRPDQSSAGFNAANGNGNLIVGGVSVRY